MVISMWGLLRFICTRASDFGDGENNGIVSPLRPAFQTLRKAVTVESVPGRVEKSRTRQHPRDKHRRKSETPLQQDRASLVRIAQFAMRSAITPLESSEP